VKPPSNKTNLDQIAAGPLAEGRVFEFLSADSIRSDFLYAFEFDSPTQLISIETAEFTCVCPFSGLPDFGRLKIEYYPRGKKAVELKALKYYLISFRNVGIYQEAATQRIQEDLAKLLACDIKVTLVYNIRGGFETICEQGSL